MIPEEDRPPSWLAGYGAIEADIRRIEEFAARLAAEVQNNYGPHLPYIFEDMSAKVPDPCDAFIELVTFLQTHQQAQQAATNLMHTYQGATGHLAAAAGEIGRQYKGSDAFTSARVADVLRAFNGTVPLPTPGTADGPPADPAVTL